MISIQGQKIPATASTGSFEEAGFSNTRAYYPYFGREDWLTFQLRSQDVIVFPDNSILLTTSVNTPNWFTVPEQSASGLSSWVITVESENSLSPFGTVTVITYKTVEMPKSNIVLYERALELLALRTSSESGGLTQETALKRLDKLKELPEDWDSYGADTINPNARAKAKSVITSVMKAFGGIIGTVVQLTDIIPLSDGGVQLEWVGPHAELEIEISPDGNIGLLYISSIDRNDYEESEMNSFQDVYNMVAKLIFSQYSS